MNGSAIRTGACFQWNENPRTSALRDICTAASPGTTLMSVVPLDHQRAAHILIPSFWAARRRSFPHERIFPRPVANTPRLAAGRTTVAALVAYLGTVWLGLAEGYWAVITCLVIVQSTLGGTLERSRRPHHWNCCGRGSRRYRRLGGAAAWDTPCSDAACVGVTAIAGRRRQRPIPHRARDRGPFAAGDACRRRLVQCRAVPDRRYCPWRGRRRPRCAMLRAGAWGEQNGRAL